ncbi:MAG: hypothetical protein WC837_14455, partial [Bellilinea sp.]
MSGFIDVNDLPMRKRNPTSFDSRANIGLCLQLYRKLLGFGEGRSILVSFTVLPSTQPVSYTGCRWEEKGVERSDEPYQ